MANPSYEKDWKTYLQCKECNQFKEINKENRYYHKEWYLWVLGRCRECVLKWRSSEREHIMSRKRDMDRYHNNPKRREDLGKWAKERTKRHEENGEQRGLLHDRTNRLIARLRIRPTECPICWNKWRIVAYHPELQTWWEIVFCCSICHSKIHRWELKKYKIIDLKKEQPKYQLLTPWEVKQMESNEKVRKLRRMCPPPARMDQSEEWIKRWKEIKD